MTLFYNNINGYKSKSESLIEIISKIDPEIIVLCEIRLPKKNTLKKDLSNYDLIAKCVKKGQGGILCGIKKNMATSAMEVTSSSNNNILVVKMTINYASIRVVIAYGPQESEPSEIKEEFYRELETEVKACEINGDHMILVGDLNSKIEEGDSYIKPLSNNGKYLEKIITRCNLKVMNFSEKCQGKWTHVIRTTDKKSVLDYVIVTKEMEEYINEVVIDEELLCTPFRVVTHNKKSRSQYSDHNSIVTRLEVKGEKYSRHKSDIKHEASWKFNEDGWKNFSKITSDTSPNIDPNSEVCEQYTKLQKYIEQAMASCFRKRNKKKENKNSSKEEGDVHKVLRKYMKLGKVQRKVALIYLEKLKEVDRKKVTAKNAEKVQTALVDLSQNDKLSQSAFWKLRKSLNLKTEVGTSVVLKTGVEIFGNSAICNAYKEEFEYRLRTRSIENHLKEYEEKTNLLCNLYAEEGLSKHNKVEVNPAKIQKIAKSLSRNKAPGPDGLPAEIFIYAGPELIAAIASIFDGIIKSGTIPTQWNKVHIKTLYKNKGSKKDLENYRGVFLTQTSSKLFEKYMMSEGEGELDNISKYQAGSRPNRSASDQLYLIRACIDHAKYLKKTVILTLYDFKQCFDGMWLEDSLISLKNIGIKEEIIASVKALNENAEIVVKTAVGNTEEFKVHNIVKQGTVIGPLLCSASTAECCVEHSTGGSNIGTTNVKSLAYVDDILDINETTDDSEEAHQVVLDFTAKKRLELSGKKCSIIVINAKNKTTPKLKIGGKCIKREKSAKYLGDILNEKGNNDDLVEDRIKKGNGSTVNIFSTIQDVTLGSFTIETTLLLYNSIYLASLLYNSQSWSCLKRKDINKLQGNQLSFLKRLLHSPKCTPTSILLGETGILPIEYEINSRKLVFLQHILKLDPTDPVKTCYYEQLKYEHENNWANEINKIRRDIQLESDDENIQMMSKTSWKEKVKEAIKRSAIEKLNSDCQRLKKVKQQYKEITVKDYLLKLNTGEARIVFAYRSGTLNIKTHRPYSYDDKLCRQCGEQEESVNHIVNQCKAVKDCHKVDIETEDINTLQVIAQRIQMFLAAVEG